MKSKLAGIQITPQQVRVAEDSAAPTMFEPRLEKELSQIHSSRQEQVRRYLALQFAQGKKLWTVYGYLHAILTLEGIGKDYQAISSDDLIAWMQVIDAKYSEGTAQLYRIRVRSFLTWIHNGDNEDADMPAVVKVIKPKQLKQDYRKHVLTKDEVLRMIQTARNQRDRALMFCLYESGCRASEMLGLRIQDIVLNEQGGYIVVKGKTGSRRIPLIESIPELQIWLNMHPFKDDKTCPVWLAANISKKALTYRALYDVVGKLAKRACLPDDVSPHSLRHSSATHHATKLNEFQMRQLYGWANGSAMPSRYVHLSGRDLDDAIRAYNGLPTKQTAVPNPTKPKECSRCHKENSALASFCMQCGMALDMKTAVELQERTIQADSFTAEVLAELMKQVPDVLAKIIAEKGGLDKIKNIASGQLTCEESELIYRNMAITDCNAYACYMYRQG